MQTNICIDAWSHARAEFCKGLKAEEVQLFSTATVETIIEEAKLPTARQQSGKISHGVESVVAAIIPYADALDVLSSTAPLVLGPLWGGLRVVLHLASEYGEYFGKLSNMFVSMADVLPRFRLYEKLFPSNDRLRTNLSHAYLDILRFCISAKKVFRHKRPSSFYLNVILRSSWKPFKKEFGTVVEAFRQHRKTIEREAGLSHMLEAADDRKNEQDARTFLQKRQKRQDRTRLLGLLSDIPWKAFHRRQQRLRHADTGLWLRDTKEFKNWMSNDNLSCLSCCGIPGAGKTVLCSSVVDHIQSLDTKPTVAYYYFDYRDEKTMTTIGALGSIAQQILVSIPVLPDSIEKILSDVYVYDFTTPLVDDLVEVLRQTLETFIETNSPVYILIDGLDECKTEVQEDLLRAVKTLTNLPKVTIKVFMFFRDDERIFKQLEHFPCIKLLEARLSGDIVAYVKDTVKNSIQDGSLVVEDPELENEIVSELISKACGMFLWVYFQLEEICDNTQSDASIRETLRNMPVGLESTYQHIAERIQLQSGRQRKIAQRILEWVIGAKRPLNILELKEAIFLEPTQNSWDCTQVPGNHSHRGLIQTCLNLVTLDDYDGTVTLTHHTVETFLISSANIHLGEHSSFLVNTRERIRDTCIAYLMFSDFGVQISRAAPALSLGPLDTFSSASIEQTADVLGIPKVVSLPFQILQGHTNHRSKPRINYGKFVEMRNGRQLDRSLSEKYCLLDYVIENWTSHLVDLATKDSEADAGFWNSLQYLALEKQAPFSFRPWDWVDLFPQEPLKPDLPYMRLFDWAIANGYSPLLRLLNTKSNNSLAECMAFANTRISHRDAVEKLVSREFNANFSSMKEALIIAATNGKVELFELILGVVGVSNLDYPVNSRCLIAAAENGCLRMVERLLEITSVFKPGTIRKSILRSSQARHTEPSDFCLDMPTCQPSGIC